MTPEASAYFPGFSIGALVMASSTDFVDAALGIANVLGGTTGFMAAPHPITKQGRREPNPYR